MASPAQALPAQAAAPRALLRSEARVKLAVAAAVAISLLLLFQHTLRYLYWVWHQEEYSHGFLIPLISGYLLWRRRHLFGQVTLRSSWAGVAVVVAGMAIYFVGAVASITTVDTYAFVIVLLGAALAVMGWQAFRIALVPLALLFLMNPIPNFFYYNLSAELQLISSQIGVAFMRLFGVSVFLEGNVIDLGGYQLQVAEACSGLRYLFPLMTLGVVVAYLFSGRAWMRWLLFLSTMPMTVLMNSFRIGLIGVLVDRYGIGQAEGFLHLFEGWVVFMVCVLLLAVEAWALLRLAGDRRSLRDMFTFEPPPAPAGPPATRSREPGKPVMALLLVLLVAVWPARALPERMEARPARADFAEFPLALGPWHGHRQALDAIYLNTLKLDDYVMADYGSQGADAPVNLYVAYYASQRTGEAAHSPRSCLPGDGWQIQDFSRRQVPGVRLEGGPLRVNRVIVQHGAERRLVYYWFQERGRDITSEYLVKWYLLEDALLRNRTDGALVRLITPLRPAEPASSADDRLAQFGSLVLPTLGRYLPN